MSLCFDCLLSHAPGKCPMMTYGLSILGPNRFMLGGETTYGPPRPSLADSVQADLAALLADDFFADPTPAPQELPRAAPDYSAYVDAFAVAAKGCEHANAVNIRYAREWHCPDCGKYLSRGDLKGSWWMYG